MAGRFSWIVALLVVLVGGGLIGVLGGGDSASQSPVSVPASAESAQVNELRAKFPGGDQAPAILVVTRSDGAALSPADIAATDQARQRMLSAAGEAPAGPPVRVSEDGQAALAVVPLDAGLSGFALTDAVEQVRGAATDGLPAALRAEVTGGPAFGADIANAFSGANFLLLAVTAAVVALLLIVTYRSPVLFLVPLAVIGFADRVAAVVGTAVSEAVGQTPDGSTSGITSVLVFGAGTNYALLLISRYREELGRDPDHRNALGVAVRAAGPAILASNATVVLALLTLVFASSPSTRSLGVQAASGLVVAAIFVLLVLPPLLAVFGRKLFWPFIPKVGATPLTEGGVWHRIADSVARRPVRVAVVSIGGLALLCTGLLSTPIGLTQTEQFRVQAESVGGYERLAAHFPSGLTDPARVIGATDRAADIQRVVSETPGVVSVQPAGTSGDGLTQWQVVLAAEPASDEAFATVDALRDAVHSVDPSSLVGGSDAQARDISSAAGHDRLVVIPAILAVVLIVLYVLLRSALAPLILVGVTVLSSVAALGLGGWASVHIFGFPALDDSTPLFAFLFLVALGVDYTIFLVTRAREETPEYGTRQGIVRAVSATGAVITSAGIVLAAVFCVLGVLPLIVLTQLGIIVGLGILLDTFLVRTVIIPALFTIIGPRIWWPALHAER
ncbi:MMPL family transporter [Mycolicibacterium sp. F2034L]|uniref:MMPL family transporter n=1 Tax=Mycolicibacterium sp. F2034L TaxID=2926422 RepID=UPI001FF3FB89|nr:MMPL family transporter [Mycolicibacterium sp. F2034L]MCK0175595.1 MMPL family transporter [Mycolicibacterium sp. F2034L]